MLKYFTQTNGLSVALNTMHVVSVMERESEVVVTMVDGRSFVIDEGYLDVVARMNEPSLHAVY